LTFVWGDHLEREASFPIDTDGGSSRWMKFPFPLIQMGDHLVGWSFLSHWQKVLESIRLKWD